MKLCGFEAGHERPFFLIAGTCVVESEAMVLDTAKVLDGQGVRWQALRSLPDIDRPSDLPIWAAISERS